MRCGLIGVQIKSILKAEVMTTQLRYGNSVRHGGGGTNDKTGFTG